MKKIKKYAWYFPNYHTTPKNDEWHGKGWTEWRCVEFAKPRFEGHMQPKVPLWGYEDEADPEVFAKKIDAALEHGFDGFIFDFYWYEGVGPYRKECLENGFLKAKNSKKCEFALMYCNHSPISAHPAAYYSKDMRLADGTVNPRLWYDVTQYCIDNYFPLENYIRVDGKPLFILWHLCDLIADCHGIDGAKMYLDNFRQRAKAAGFDIHIAADKHRTPEFIRYCDLTDETEEEYSERRKKCNELLEYLGIDSVTSYNWFNPKPKCWPKIEYSEYTEENIKGFSFDDDFYDIPVSMTVSTGWDTTPRSVQSDMYDPGTYAGGEVVVGNTPEAVEKAFAKTKKYINSDKHRGHFLTVSTWNEWTEGNYMEPDEEYGYGYLEAFKRVFKKDE